MTILVSNCNQFLLTGKHLSPGSKQPPGKSPPEQPSLSKPPPDEPQPPGYANIGSSLLIFPTLQSKWMQTLFARNNQVSICSQGHRSRCEQEISSSCKDYILTKY